MSDNKRRASSRQTTTKATEFTTERPITNVCDRNYVLVSRTRRDAYLEVDCSEVFRCGFVRDARSSRKRGEDAFLGVDAGLYKYK